MKISTTLLISLVMSLPALGSIETCKYQFRWGHGDDIEPNLKRVIKRNNVCTVGQGCYIKENSGNLPGLIPSIGYNGDWMGADFQDDYNGGKNPVMAPSAIPNSEKGNDVNAVGFMRMTEHNWMTLLLKAMSNSNSSKKCKKVNIKFACEYEGEEDEVWDRRVSRSQKTDLKDVEGRNIAYIKKNCAHGIETVPTKCGQRFSLTTKQLKDVYVACQDRFNKYIALNPNHYLKVRNTMVSESTGEVEINDSKRDRNKKASTGFQAGNNAKLSTPLSKSK